MMKYTRNTLLLLFLLFAGQVMAQGKIGYITPDEIYPLMPETKKADSALQAYQKELAEAYQQLESEVNEVYGKFVKDSAKLSPAVREAKRGDLQTRIADLQNKEQQFNKMLEDAKEKQLKPVRDKMVKAIQEVAKENGYAHVLYKEYALVFPEADDLADRVKKKLGVK